jgi:uncharacterized protein GlcG (DUF336 family)
LRTFSPRRGAWLVSIDIAKRQTSAAQAFGIAKRKPRWNSQTGCKFPGVNPAYHGQVKTCPDGTPREIKRHIVGALGTHGGGCHGGAVADAAAAAWC